MKIDIVTLFPAMFIGPLSESIVKRSQEKGLVQIAIHDLRRWSQDSRGTIDDKPYGGGPGMVILVEPIKRAIDELKSPKARVVLLDAGGKKFDQQMAAKMSKVAHLIIICGHYEGVDQRVKEHLADDTISIGDYVLTGGELPAMVVVDTLVRLIPGVLGKDESSKEESFTEGLLEYPQFTRPETYMGWEVPKVLLSGNHQEIKKWREEMSMNSTKKIRPDLLKTK